MDDIETYYLIDYENVHGDGLDGCQSLGQNDHIVIFFTQNAKSIDMSDISNHGEADLEMIEVPAGKQSADMHIGSYVGYLAGKNGKNCNVVIVSNDSDFDNVIRFWNGKTGIVASRAQQIKKKETQKPKINKPEVKVKEANISKANGTDKTKLNQEVMQAIRNAGYNAQIANTVAKIVVSLYDDERILSEAHNALRKQYTDYLNIYAIVKPIISKYTAESINLNNEASSVNKDKTTANTEIQKVLSKAGYANDIIAYVASMAVKNLGVKNGKQQIYRALTSKYGQEKGLVIYNYIKKSV